MLPCDTDVDCDWRCGVPALALEVSLLMHINEIPTVLTQEQVWRCGVPYLLVSSVAL